MEKFVEKEQGLVPIHNNTNEVWPVDASDVAKIKNHFLRLWVKHFGRSGIFVILQNFNKNKLVFVWKIWSKTLIDIPKQLKINFQRKINKLYFPNVMLHSCTICEVMCIFREMINQQM